MIRREFEREEAAKFAALKAELERAFATPDEDYVALDAKAVIERARKRCESKSKSTSSLDRPD